MKVINFFKNSDRLFALMMIIIAMVMYALIGGMDEPYSPGAMSASTYPRVVLASIIFVSTLLIIRPANTSKTQNAKSCRGIVVIIIMIAYISLLETIGFFHSYPGCFVYHTYACRVKTLPIDVDQCHPGNGRTVWCFC